MEPCDGDRQEVRGRPLLDAAGVFFSFGKKDTLKGVSVSVTAGETVGLIGSNGAGKTTLLRVLAGLLRPGAGEVRLEGAPIAGMGRRRIARSLAMLAQDTAFEFPFTAFEVVLMGRHPHLGLLSVEGKEDVEAAIGCMEEVGVKDLAGRPINELSGGERRLVMLCQALAQRPKVLLLDEPGSHLDIGHLMKVHELLREKARAAGIGVICAVHDLNVAACFCDRLVLLKNGAVFAAGRPEDVLTEENVREAFAAEVFIGKNEATGARMVVPLGGGPRARSRRREGP